MTLASVGPLLLAWMIAVMSPGPDLLMILQQTAPKQGRDEAHPLAPEEDGPSPRARGVVAGLGVMTGNLLWMTAAALGIGTLVALFPQILAGLKIAGGLVLIWLGLSGLWTLRRAIDPKAPVIAPRRSTLKNAYLKGLTTNLANPKAVIFFAALFAPFFSHGYPWWQTVVLLGVVLITGLAWFSAFAWAASTGPVVRFVRRWWVVVEIGASVLFVLIGLGFLIDGVLGLWG